MSDDILTIFEGLTPNQAKELRAQIIPTLRVLREEIIKNANNEKGNHEHKNQNHEGRKRSQPKTQSGVMERVHQS